MKNSGKLEINPDRIMKNEELITLRGGEETGSCYKCYSEGYTEGCMGYLGSFYYSECLVEYRDQQQMCQLMGYSNTHCIMTFCYSNCSD